MKRATTQPVGHLCLEAFPTRQQVSIGKMQRAELSICTFHSCKVKASTESRIPSGHGAPITDAYSVVYVK